MEISVGTHSSVRYWVEVRYWECPLMLRSESLPVGLRSIMVGTRWTSLRVLFSVASNTSLHLSVSKFHMREALP